MKKTKSIITIIMGVVAFLTSSCSSNTYKIEGTTSGVADGKLVRLSTWGMESQSLDSAIVKDGKFEFTRTYGEAEENYALNLSCVGDETKNEWASLTLYAEPGKTIKAHLDMQDYKKNSISGSPLNDKENAHYQEVNKWSDIIIPLRMKANDPSLTIEERQKADRDADIEYMKLRAIEEQYMLDNADNLIGISKFETIGATFSKKAKQQFMEMVAEKYKNHPALLKEKERMEVEGKTAEGQSMTDLEMETPEGKMVKLSDFTGKTKLTLIDFWASWCGPCRKEMPNIRKIYADYKSQGLGLIGVSLDTDKDKWVNAIAYEKLDYPQMSDLKGWKSAAAPAYNIQGIPFTLLISQDGTIVGRNLHGEELVKRIEDYLAQ